jgi:predicted GTPase
MSERVRTLILGAGGRDFHNFNVYYRGNDHYEVVAFTATQIPGIDERSYPPELSGPLYPNGIPILPEENLAEIINEHNVREVVFAYSDVSHEYVMHMASKAHALGCDFKLLGPKSSQIAGKIPVLAICATRTGAGKSPTTRKVSDILKTLGVKTVVVRHPMPYGELKRQAVQRFATLEDLDTHECTIEEREEYEPHIKLGNIVYAGVDYGAILDEASKECEILLWDGGNNDASFYKTDLLIVVVDPHRPGHELQYHPGEANLRSADVILINKVGTARKKDIETVEQNSREANPNAIIVKARCPISVDNSGAIKGKKVLVIEDGPTLTHGEMTYGAGVVAAREFEAGSIVDPRQYAVGEIAKTFKKYPLIGPLLPAMGYGEQQVRDLHATVNACPVDLVIVATPINLVGLFADLGLELNKPAVVVTYDLQDDGGLEDAVKEFVKNKLRK